MLNNPAAHSNVLFTLVGYEIEPAQQRYEEARRFAEKALATHPAGFERYRDRLPDPDPDRRLKVGLISPDFCRHAVSYFIEPLLDKWDRKQLEIILYSNGEVRDDYTIRLQKKADQWREIRLLSQEEIIAMMLRDEVDILIDLAGHTAGNRLGLMAGKPAPIQATYLGYYGTTGLTQVDYWLTDSVLHPHLDGGGEGWWSCEHHLNEQKEQSVLCDLAGS
jgi:predicted O-linked N-acetylglucosamine transferase (SPINDLY family)